MTEYFSIGEAAKIAQVTSETLRHYDRIGLVSPSMKNEKNNYRYYTSADLLRVNTVRVLQQLDIPLREIKEVLADEDLHKVVAYLAAAEKKAEQKITMLQASQRKIQTVKEEYLAKAYRQQKDNGVFIQEFSQRAMLLSDNLEFPTLNNLWNDLAHFYEMLTPLQQKGFEFEDVVGIYSTQEQNQFFTLCRQYPENPNLKILPAGQYLCANCNKEQRASVLAEVKKIAQDKYQVTPQFDVQMIVVSGILQWRYQIQVLISNNK